MVILHPCREISCNVTTNLLTMKKIFVFIVACLIQISGFSQGELKKIQLSNDIELIKLSDNAYVHVSYSEILSYGRVASNGLVFIQNGEAFLFDTPTSDSLTKELLQGLTDSLNVKVVGFVPNHCHGDCMGGLAYLKEKGIKSYANNRTITIARSKNLPIPDYGFTDSLQLQLAGKPINCYFPGAAHSTDNIVVWIPSEKILFPGCMVKTIGSTNLGNTADGNVKAYPATIDYLMAKFPDAKIVIPGHGQLGGFELIEHTKKLSKNK